MNDVTEFVTKGRDRFGRERKTIRLMIEMYCRGNHKGRAELCAECKELLAYSMEKINRCRYHYNKPVCSRCPIHCYKQNMRKQIKQVMRYSDPRMMLYHPILAVLHYIDGMARKESGQKK